MKHLGHVLASWRNLRKNRKDLYQQDKRKCFELVKEIHYWFDEFAGKKSETYDYTKWITPHRQERHHLDGISECVVTFSRKYGFEYSDFIMVEATRHVRDDMKYLPNKEDYKTKDFWKIWSLRK